MTKKTRRLTLRPLALKDYLVWREAYSSMREVQNEWDEANWRDEHLTKKAFREILKYQADGMKKGQAYIFGIFRNDDGALLGRIGLHDISRGIFQNAYLSYRIFNPYWRYGYAKEAVKATLELSFGPLKLHRIEAGVQPKNMASIAVAEAAKLKKESLSKKRLFHRGRWVDLLLYAATCENFKIKYKFPRSK